MERVLDQQGRWRNKVIAFRMSPEEDEVLEAKVKLSGLTKQEYIIRRLTDREITVVGNPRVYKALRDQMKLQERDTLLFFLARGMANGSLCKEIPLKSIPDGVVFCHPIIPKGAPF